MGAVWGRNTREGLLDGIRKEVQAADFPAAQDGVHLGSHFLNRVEIWAVEWKVQYFHTRYLQNFPDSLYVANAFSPSRRMEERAIVVHGRADWSAEQRCLFSASVIPWRFFDGCYNLKNPFSL